MKTLEFTISNDISRNTKIYNGEFMDLERKMMGWKLGTTETDGGESHPASHCVILFSENMNWEFQFNIFVLAKP